MLKHIIHKWHLNLNNTTHTSLASHSGQNSFVLKHECEPKDYKVLLFQIRRHLYKESIKHLIFIY